MSDDCLTKVLLSNKFSKFSGPHHGVPGALRPLRGPGLKDPMSSLSATEAKAELQRCAKLVRDARRGKKQALVDDECSC